MRKVERAQHAEDDSQAATAIRNSSIPYSTSFSVDVTISSSSTHHRWKVRAALARQAPEGRLVLLFEIFFAGLVFDANMGLPMHYTDKGVRDNRPKPRTACKDINGATPNFVVYADFESGFPYLVRRAGLDDDYRHIGCHRY